MDEHASILKSQTNDGSARKDGNNVIFRQVIQCTDFFTWEGALE